MEKRVVFGFLLCFFIALPFVQAGSLGMTPTYFKEHFESNLAKNYTFEVFSAEPDQLIEIYVRGDLANYVTLSDKSFIGGGKFTAVMNLPDRIEIPGTHTILIGAIESNPNSSGVSGLAAVQVPIVIVVPYPGKYLESSFELGNINLGEKASFKIEFNNLGTDSLTINSRIELYEGNEILKTQTIEEKIVKTKEKEVINDFLDSEDLGAGAYTLRLIIDYGKESIIEKEFKVGQLLVNITDYSNKFSKGKINRFEVEAENLWNSELQNVYASVSVTDMGLVLDDFVTPSMNMKPWERLNLSGFFDATNVTPGNYTAGVTVYYSNKSSYRFVKVYVNEEIRDNSFFRKVIFGAIGAGIVFLILLVVIIYLMVRLRSKNAKKNKK